MRTLATQAIDTLASRRPRLRGIFTPFKEVLAIDSALLRLHDALEPFYPSVWTNHTRASAKLTVVMNVVGRGAKTVDISHGSCHDSHMLVAGPWMKGRLLVFDLGYYRVPLFIQVEHFQGFFLSRSRKHQNPIITHCRTPGHEHLVGMKLKDALERVDGTLLDVDADVGYLLRHEDRPFVTSHRAEFRFVAVYNHDIGRWHCYVTNLPATAMKPEHFTAVYAARWEVELLFRELETVYRLEQMPSSNKHVTETFIYAALLTLAVSRRLYRLVASRSATERLPFDRWARLVATVALDLLDLMLSRTHRAHLQRRIHRLLLAEAIDPNKARLPLQSRAQRGIYCPC